MRQSLVLCLSVVLFVSGCRTCGSRRIVTIDRPNCSCHVAATNVSTGQKTSIGTLAPKPSDSIVGKFNELQATEPQHGGKLPLPTFATRETTGREAFVFESSPNTDDTDILHSRILENTHPQDPTRETLFESESNRRTPDQTTELVNSDSDKVADRPSIEYERENIEDEARLGSIEVAEVEIPSVEVAEVELPESSEVAADVQAAQEPAETENSFAEITNDQSPAVLPEPNADELETLFDNSEATEDAAPTPNLFEGDEFDIEPSKEPSLDSWTSDATQPLASLPQESSLLESDPMATDSQTLSLTSPGNDQPVVLYARPTQHHTPASSRFENLKSEVNTDDVGSSIILSTFPAAPESQNGVDPRFGLPLTDQVEFSALPKMDESNSTEVAQLQREMANAQQLMLVVYRDEEGRLFLAPPATHVAPDSQRLALTQESNAVTSRGGEPIAPPKQYYLPPEPILRLKATTPIGQPTRHPSVAKILMRDTVIVDGTHLLAMPEINAKKQHIGQLSDDGSPSIDYEKLREAIRRLTPSNEEKLR